MRVQVEEVITLSIPADQKYTGVASSVPFANYSSTQSNPPTTVVCGATSTELYRAYCNLFDQVKCDGVISKVSVTTPIGSSNASVPALQIVTSYDRAGSFMEATQTDFEGLSDPVTYVDLQNSSGSVIRSALNNSVAKTSRSCWASDIQERTTFHDCTLQEDEDVPANHNDICYGANRTTCPFFCPLFYVGFYLPTQAPSQPTPINFILSQTYYFTFRNPKYGSSGGAATTQSSRVLSDPVATHTLDEDPLDDLPQAAIDGFARAADATGRMVRAAPTRVETRAGKRARLMDEADTVWRDAADRWNKYEEERARLYAQHRTTNPDYIPPHDRARLDMMERQSRQRFDVADTLASAAADLDKEDTLSRTDTLPLND